MSISISNALSVGPATAANSSPAPAAQSIPQATTGPVDTVQLTEAQQVFNLYTQGQSVSQIATTLDLTVPVVNSYLGLSSNAT